MADGRGPSHTSWKVTPWGRGAFASSKEDGLLRRMSSWSTVREAEELLVRNMGWNSGPHRLRWVGRRGRSLEGASKVPGQGREVSGVI